MSNSTHTEPEELVSDHVEVASNALTDAIGVVVPGVSSSAEPSKDDETEESKETDEKRKD
jgi:hypothetical protein